MRRRYELAVGALAAAGAVALVSAVIEVARPHVPVLSLGVLYVLAVLPIAVVWGVGLATAASVASMLTFNFLFLPPRHTLHLREGEDWFALLVYVGTAVVVGALAARARARRQEAEQRRREADVLAEVAADLLAGVDLREELDRIGELAAGVLGVPAARVALARGDEEDGGGGYPLRAALRTVGTVHVDGTAEPDREAVARFLPALAALLAVAVDREQLEREAREADVLRESDAVKTALLRTVSHDLRSPLTAIIAAAGALSNDELRLDAADRAGLAETIRSEATRLDRVVGNLLDLSRLEAGALEAHRQLWTLDALLAEALADLGPAADRVEIELDPRARPVEVDGAQIERVLANLLENALKFSPPAAPVNVRVEQAATELRVHVVDLGSGIPPAQRAAMFEPFHRGGTRGGSGLGLAIARGFAEANGGRLWAQDDAVGAHLVLALPTAAQQVIPA